MSAPAQLPMTWRYCGDQIKRWRSRAGLTRAKLSEAAGYDVETVRAMEAGRRRPTPKLLMAADELCAAQGMLVGAQDFLTPERHPVHIEDYMAIEADAVAMQSYEPLFIPGLLQTTEYARVILSGTYPPPDDETIEERIAIRMRRQEILKRRLTTTFSFVIYEAALRTMMGGRGCMARQLRHLSEVGRLGNVSVQVLPVESAVVIALGGSAVILETPEHRHYAYIEGAGTRVLDSDPGVASTLIKRHVMLVGQALSTGESGRLIEKLADELETGSGGASPESQASGVEPFPSGTGG